MVHHPTRRASALLVVALTCLTLAFAQTPESPSVATPPPADDSPPGIPSPSAPPTPGEEAPSLPDSYVYQKPQLPPAAGDCQASGPRKECGE
jgi:hypothetical protein